MLPFNDPAKLKTKRGSYQLEPLHLRSACSTFVFEEIYIARDSGTLEQLKELSSRRRAIEESINESSSATTVIRREMSGGLTSQYQQDLQKLEQYLPLLENLVFHVGSISNNPQMVRWTSDLMICWSSALTGSSFFNLMGPKFFHINNLQFEVVMAHFLYGAILRERASEVMSGDLVQSATHYRKAAGVYDYLARELLPSLRTPLAPERPPEATSSISSIMSLICLAEAQAVTVRKAEEKGSSGDILSKLHCGIAQLLDEAVSILHSAKGDCRDISEHFVEFISSCRSLHRLKSQKHLAEGLKVAGQLGAAVGVLRHALSNTKGKLPREESWNLVFGHEIDKVSEMLRKFEHENEFVWQDKIPSEYELPSAQGKKIVSALPYCPQRWERELVFSI